MRKFFSLMVAVFMTVLAFGQSYGILVNGTTYFAGEAAGEFEGFTQYLAHVQLQKGDYCQLYDFENKAAWAVTLNTASVEGFDMSNDRYEVSVEGCYDFYIKLKFNADELYIGTGSNCGDGVNIGGGDTPVDPQPSGNAYTLTFTYFDKVDGDGSAKLTTVETIFDEASQPYVATVDVGTQVYAGRKYANAAGDSVFSNLKLGSSSAAGELKFTLANPTEVDSIVFQAAMYAATEGGDGFKVNDENFTLSAGKLVFEDKVWKPEGKVSTIDIVQNKASKGRFFLTAISVYPKNSGDTPVDPQPEVAHYLIGNAAEMGAWTIENALPMDGDSIDLELAEGGYAFKIVPSKAWDQPGQLDCNAIAEGQEKLSCDNSYNISFTMPSAAKVTIKVLENKVYVLGIPDGELVVPDTHYLIGDSAVMGGWDFEKAPFMEGDSIQLTLPAGIYRFKIVATKAWDQPGQLDCSNLAEGQENVGCEGQGNDQKNVKLYLAEQATITIKIIDGKIYVFGIPGTVDPQPGETKYYLKNNWDGAAEWYWKEMTATEDYFTLEGVVFGGTGVDLNTAASDEEGNKVWYAVEDIDAYDANYEPATLEARDTVVFIYTPSEKLLSAVIIGKGQGGETPVNPQPSGNAYTLTFTYFDKVDGDGSTKLTTVETIFDEASQPYVATVDVGTQVYAGRKYANAAGDSVFSNLKLGSSSAAGELKFTLANPTEVDSIVFQAAMYAATEGAEGFKVNDENFTLSAGKLVFEDKVWKPTGEVATIDIVQNKASKGRFFLTAIVVYPKASGDDPVDPQPSEVTYSLKNNWDGGADWYWKEMEQKAPHLWQLNNVVFGGTGVNLISSEEGFDERWYPVGDEKLRGDAIEALDTVSFDWDPVADTLCAKIVGKYIPGETPQTRYFLKNNWDGGEWRWKEMSAVPTVENYWQLQDVFGGTGVNLNTQASDEGQQWFPLDKIVGGDQIQAEDTVLFVYNAVDGTLAARLIGRPGGDTPGPQDPSAAIAISLLQWVPVPFTLSEDKSYATLSYRIPAGEYEFKMVINGASYRSNGYNFHRGYTGVAGLVDNVDANMTLQADVTGEYTIIWVFATDSIEFRFPEKPDDPTDMIDLYLVPGVWNQDGAKYACLTLSDLPADITDIKDLTIERLMMAATVSDWFVGGDTTVAKIPADTKVVAFGRFNPVVETPSIEAIVTPGMLWNHSDILALDPSLIYTISGWAEEGKDFCPGYWGEKSEGVDVPDGFYLVGSFNDWTLSEDYKLNANSGADGEYMVQLTLTEGDEFQIWVISNGQKTMWFPLGEGKNFVVDAAHAGKVNIYFRPNGNPEWPDYFFFVEVDNTQGLKNINTIGKVVKMIQNGQIMIIKDNKTYNVLGTLVK